MKVYVSSTFEDLAEFRQAVSLVARRLGLDDVTIEWYVAGTRPALEECLRGVAEADIYLGLVAWRYGYIPPGQDRSITELEYRAAVEHSKPRLIFLLSEDAPWRRALMDRDVTRVDQFRTGLMEQQTCYTFTRPEDLAEAVAEALNLYLPEAPVARPGELDSTIRAAYLLRLQQQYSRMELAFPNRLTDSGDLMLTPAFVESAVRKRPPPDEAADEHGSAASEKPSFGLFATVAAPANRKLVLLGDPGSGKSTITRYLALALARPDPGPELSELQGYLPLIIQLRTYQSMVSSRQCNDFLDCLDDLYATEALGIPKPELLQFMNLGGKALFLLDGLDEIVEVGFRQEVSRQIAALADEYPRIRILVTSRIFGYVKANLEMAGFAHFVLEELDDARIGEFVRRQYELAGPGSFGEAGALSRRTLDAIWSSPVLRQLAGSPLLLTILSAIGLDRPLSGSRWELYEQSTTALLERWDVNRYLSEQDVGAAFLGIEDKKQLLRLLAYKMQETGGNYISSQDFLLIAEDYLSSAFELDPVTAREIARTMMRQFRERDFILVWHSTAQIGFIHRSFLEYFCASAVIERFRSRDLNRQDLQKLALDHQQDPSWALVLAFVSEVLGERLLAYEMGEVFKPVGTPTLTFVEPQEFSRFLMTLRQPGLGIVIEGPSGIGKTTFIRQAERREREHGMEIRILSARRPQDLTAIAALPSGHTGTIAVDDFHRLEPAVREAVSDYLKLLADEESENRLIIIGIPGIGKNLVDLSFDLATRISTFRLSKAPPESVRALIERGEESLNIAFHDRNNIITEANGSLQTAQVLCWHIAQQGEVERTQAQRKVLGTPVASVIPLVDAQLSTKFDHTMRQFLLLDGKRGQVLPELLRLLSRTDDGILALDSVKQARPDLAAGIDQYLLDAFPGGFGSGHPQLERDLYLDPVTQRLIAEDPQLLFFLRHKPFDQLVRMSAKKHVTRNQIFISYSHRDQAWLKKLEPHLSALADRGHIDYWADTRIRPSVRWRDEIEAALNRAAAAILLVTPSFLASEFIKDVELAKLLSRADSDGCQVWSLIVRPSVFSGVPELARFQTFNSPATPVSKLRLHQQDELFSRLALALAELFPADANP